MKSSKITERLAELGVVGGPGTLKYNPHLEPFAVTTAIVGLQQQRLVVVRTDGDGTVLKIEVR
jgi:hypothetical protein